MEQQGSYMCGLVAKPSIILYIPFCMMKLSRVDMGLGWDQPLVQTKDHMQCRTRARVSHFNYCIALSWFVWPIVDFVQQNYFILFFLLFITLRFSKFIVDALLNEHCRLLFFILDIKSFFFSIPSLHVMLVVFLCVEIFFSSYILVNSKCWINLKIEYKSNKMSLKGNEKRKEKKKQMGSLSFFVKNFIFVDIEFGLQIFGSCGFYDVRFDSNLYSFNVSVIEFFF